MRDWVHSVAYRDLISLFSETALIGLGDAAIGAIIALWYFGQGLRLGE